MEKELEEILEKLLKEVEFIKGIILEKAERFNSDILDVRGAAKLLKVSIHTIYAYTYRKRIPCYKKGKKIYFSKKELELWGPKMHKIKLEKGNIYD